MFLDPPRPPEGACLGMAIDTFFPEVGRGGRLDYAPALAICSGCWAVEECLTYASAVEAMTPLSYLSGVLAGMDPVQRADYYRALRRVA